MGDRVHCRRHPGRAPPEGRPDGPTAAAGGGRVGSGHGTECASRASRASHRLGRPASPPLAARHLSPRHLSPRRPGIAPPEPRPRGLPARPGSASTLGSIANIRSGWSRRARVSRTSSGSSMPLVRVDWIPAASRRPPPVAGALRLERYFSVSIKCTPPTFAFAASSRYQAARSGCSRTGRAQLSGGRGSPPRRVEPRAASPAAPDMRLPLQPGPLLGQQRGIVARTWLW